MLMLVLMPPGCANEEKVTVNAADIYQSACASCHGTRGTGGVPAQEGAPAPRDFTELAWQRSMNDEELVRVVSGGKGSAMPSFAEVLSPHEIEAAIEHVRSFTAMDAPGPSAGGGS
jgi:mono/diheme cytochrome c family protein